jgi:hypothetical protein
LETGVFITADPAGFVDGPNLYTYVNQNPWTKFDPEGLYAAPIVHPGQKLNWSRMEALIETYVQPAAGLAASFVPGVTQAQALHTLTDSKASTFEKVVAGVTMVPELGAIVKDVGILAKGLKTEAKVAEAVNDANKAASAATKAESTAESTVAKMQGNSQKTGTPGHDTTSSSIAKEMANSGEYETVHENQTLKTITGGKVDSNLRPDVAGATIEGKVDVVEIPSKSQTVQQMQKKVQTMENQLGENAGTKSRVEPIRQQTTDSDSK